MKTKLETILYVDDELENLETFQLTFLRDYQVLVAQTGDQALRLLEEHFPKVVITDQRMPGMSGVDLLVEVKRLRPDVTRILLTAYSDMEAIASAVNQGEIYRYLTKPWRRSELKNAIDNGVEMCRLKLQNKTLLASLQVMNEELTGSNEQLREEIQQRARLATAVEQTSDLVAILDGQAMVVYANRSAQQVSAGPGRQSFPVHVEGWLVSAGLDWRLLLRKAQEDGGWSGRIAFAPGPQEHVFECSLSPVRWADGQRQAQEFVLVGKDITREVAIMDRLNQKERLEAIGRMAGEIAHDFNNLIAPIDGFANLLLDDLPPGSQSQADARKILAAAQKAKELTQRILTFSRSKLLRRQRTDMVAVVEETLGFVRPSALRQGIRLSLEAQGAARHFMGDPLYLHQIAMNLIRNAMQAMPKGGLLRVRIFRDILEKNLKTAQEYLCLSIEDQGVGIPPEILGRIFEPFFSTRSDKQKGAGLGLSIVHNLATAMDGEVFVQSRLGSGSVFMVAMPYRPGLEDEPL